LIDVAIIGGGVSGLWLLDLLTTLGLRVRLFTHELGGEQTAACQGMIHGGLRYADSPVMAQMPARWRACLEGRGEVDLRGVRVAADRQLIWSTNGVIGRATMAIARRVLAGRIQQTPYRHTFDLLDPVIDVASLVKVLADRHAGHIRVASDDWLTIQAGTVIYAAGAGNQVLLRGTSNAAAMMRLPLHQVIVRHPALPALFGHCIGPSLEPRLTITTHGDTWRVGGALAIDGCRRSAVAQREAAIDELLYCVPWVDLEGATFDTQRIDRVEPAFAGGRRSATAFAQRVGSAIVVWPVKLTLLPDLGDRVLALL